MKNVSWAKRQTLSLAVKPTTGAPRVPGSTVTQMFDRLYNLEAVESGIAKIKLPEHPDLRAKLKNVLKLLASAAVALEDVANEADNLR